ncbi:hypothetical protein PUN28_012924 [Cardiocondyla obscurior]|uniref:Uncharacterized protein n=1 Tax=Cardiocondyla obscurior TaxID=286306 RepID=A0AAW2FA19_9HYME
MEDFSRRCSCSRSGVWIWVLPQGLIAKVQSRGGTERAARRGLNFFLWIHRSTERAILHHRHGMTDSRDNSWFRGYRCVTDSVDIFSICKQKIATAIINLQKQNDIAATWKVHLQGNLQVGKLFFRGKNKELRDLKLGIFHIE